MKRIVHTAVTSFFEFQTKTRSNAVRETTRKGDKRYPDGNTGTQIKFKELLKIDHYYVNNIYIYNQLRTMSILV